MGGAKSNKDETSSGVSGPRPVIHVVDDDASLRTALVRLLQAAGFEAQAYASAGEFLISRVRGIPGCLLLDVQMPGPNGFELQECLAKDPEPLPVIFLTAHGDIRQSVRAIKAGAVDFLTKPVCRDELFLAVRSALARDAESRVTRDRLKTWRASLNSLTVREREVFEGVVSGKLNKQIAADLGKAQRTVKAHRAHLMEKLKVRSVAELVHIADALQIRASDRARS
jgi:FixJ family two-component response regulator